MFQKHWKQVGIHYTNSWIYYATTACKKKKQTIYSTFSDFKIECQQKNINYKKWNNIRKHLRRKSLTSSHPSNSTTIRTFHFPAYRRTILISLINLFHGISDTLFPPIQLWFRHILVIIPYRQLSMRVEWCRRSETRKKFILINITSKLKKIIPKIDFYLVSSTWTNSNDGSF